MNYHDYLNLDKLLSAQKPVSPEKGTMAHDEMLFITVHHSYEIWFKQMLFEMKSILDIFSQPKVAEAEMGVVVHRLDRIVAIFKNLIQQVDILETMTPLDFLEFRNLLYPASGFQSLQFRILENYLGLKTEQRLPYNDQHYTTQLKKEQVSEATSSENGMNLFVAIESWLERTPFLDSKEFLFWKEYQTAVRTIFQNDMSEIEQNQFLSKDQKEKAKEQMTKALKAFDAIFDPTTFSTQQAAGDWRFSFKAVRGALLIQLYRDQPLFQQAFRLLSLVQDLDIQLTQWRYRHALMAQRMLGRKVGTGGSSGASYLRSTAEKHRVFQDLNQLTSFFIPKSQLPKLPEIAQKAMGFNFSRD